MNMLITRIKEEYMGNKKELLKSFVLLCIIGIIILPLIAGAFYALPAADDFSNAQAIKKSMQDHNIFIEACLRTKETYLGWQGTFMSTF